ncbi:MAG TPA: hypothetical protein DEF51_44485, partial [Myxococcales bacterium]|nr:hypothetical protein [Myxococcales bacterium]
MPATPHASASRAFCDACHALASTAARPSSELLFTLPPPTEPDGDRHSVPLAELVARAPTERPRSSFAPLTTPWLYAPVVPAQRPRNVLAAVAM